tara:strand:+ start:18432 stop:18770 length:339 start_codon:yes stop_codon:yes gene_type:complete
MKLSLKYASLLIAFCVMSCNSNKKVSEDNKISSDQELIDEGFKKAVILHSDKEEDCPYVLSIDNESLLFDPVNLESNYKSANIEVWVKYRPLRMPNRCEKANPVEIIEIRKA